MKKVINKWFWVWNSDKEIHFLEDMARKGFKLTKVRLGQYVFEEDIPRKLRYQCDFRPVSNKISEDEYIHIFQDSGWNFVSRFGGWYYFVHEWDDKGVDLSIFNNSESHRAMYRRLILFLIIIGLPLYAQLVITFPNMDVSEFEFPHFYFFMRIILIVLVVLHASALARIFYMYHKLKNPISE